MFDLEDAVVRTANRMHGKRLRRSGTVEATNGGGADNPPASPEHAADLELVGSLRGLELLTVVVPKVETPETLFGVSAALDEEIGLQALIETPAGIEAVEEIAMSTPRLRALILGYADLAAALGRRGAERHVERWLYYQEVALAAARSAGLHAIDGRFWVSRSRCRLRARRVRPGSWGSMASGQYIQIRWSRSIGRSPRASGSRTGQGR